MAKYWCKHDGTRVFRQEDYREVPGLILMDDDESTASVKPKAAALVIPEAAEPEPVADAPESIDVLIQKYEAKFGKKPHHSMKAASITKALEE